jgi:hypothetical protein
MDTLLFSQSMNAGRPGIHDGSARASSDDIGNVAVDAREVIERVGEMLCDRLTELNKQSLSSSAVRWENRVQFVRLKLVRQGLPEKQASRGFWAITRKGREHVASRVAGSDKA